MLADGSRIQILWALIDREMPVNEIAATIGKPGPLVSQHLAKLRMARLVRTRRDGTQIFSQLENDHVRELIVDAVHNAEHAGPAVPAHHLVRDGDLTAIPDHRATITADKAAAGGRRDKVLTPTTTPQPRITTPRTTRMTTRAGTGTATTTMTYDVSALDHDHPHDDDHSGCSATSTVAGRTGRR